MAKMVEVPNSWADIKINWDARHSQEDSKYKDHTNRDLDSTQAKLASLNPYKNMRNPDDDDLSVISLEDTQLKQKSGDIERSKQVLKSFFTSKKPLLYRMFMSSLKHVYGTALQRRIASLPHFQKLEKKMKSGEFISKKDAHLAMLAVNSQLTLEDVEEYRKNNSSSAQLSQSQIIMKLKNPFSILGLDIPIKIGK